MNIHHISKQRQQEHHVEDNFDKLCRPISEEQWQLNRAKYKRMQMVTALIIAVPAIFILCSAITAAYLLLH